MPIQLKDVNGNLVAMTNAQKTQFVTELGVAFSNQAAKSWRGIGQGMSLAIQGFAGGANVWSQTNRTRHYSNVRFKRVRAVLQTFWMTGNPIADTLFTTDYNFQVGFELGYTNAVTGLQPRLPFTFSGSTVASYRVATPPANGYIVSDVLELPRYVEASEFYGLWTTTEAAGRTGDNLIPYSRNGSNYNQRYVGAINSPGVSQIDANSCFAATSVNATTTSQSGASSYYSPCMLLVETDDGRPFVFIMGDSISYGVGEGAGGSGAYGDTLGSPLSNSGWAERAIYENLGYSAVNVSKGSDRAQYFANPNNWKYRRALMQLANPTHVISSNVHNDIATTISINGRVVSTQYAKYDVFLSNGNMYMCSLDGTTSANSAGLTATSKAVLDGTAFFEYLNSPTSTGRAAAQIFAWQANLNQQILTATPNAKIIGMLPTPDAGSTDGWLTVENQTASTNWGDATSRRGVIYSLMAANRARLGYSALVDPNTYLEAGAPNTTSKWFADGSNKLTNDGVHDNSYGYFMHAKALTADLF